MVIHPENTELRRISPEKWESLKKSILEHGVYRPIHVWEQERWALSGNHLLKAIRELVQEGHTLESPSGRGFVPVIFHDVGEKEAKAIFFQTNNTFADWVEDNLSNAIKRYSEIGGDVYGLGFPQGEIEAIMGVVDQAIKETAPIMEKVEELNEQVIQDAVNDPPVEAQRTLTLSEGVYDQLEGVLIDIAKRLNPDWKKGDSFNEAVAALVQIWRERQLSSQVA